MTNHISINVRDFIVKNYTPYDGDGSFLAGPTQRTKKLWEELSVLLEKERNSPGRVLDADTKVISTITALTRAILIENWSRSWACRRRNP